ncbi:hypothetical protein DENSPDRAFT_835624 [Dentipellis sp. KUC8613]|nr:hypothetical protein DENSPDRAFT_835624 [Dentipellis sp. KUC8613]
MGRIDVGRYSILACYTLIVYDWLISISDEYTLIHQARWTWVKAAYLWCRYYPLLVFPFHIWGWVVDHDGETCADIVHPLYATLIPLQLSAQVVLMLRAYAFAGRDSRILYGLCFGLAALLGVDIYVWGFDVQLVSTLFSVLGQSGCFATTDISASQGAIHISLTFLTAFAYDLLTMSIVIIHCFRIRSTQGSLGASFLTQGVLVFMSMTTLNIFSAAMYLSSNKTFNGIGSYFALLLPDVLACRLVLMLRRRVSPTESVRQRECSQLVRDALELLPVSNEDIEVANEIETAPAL